MPYSNHNIGSLMVICHELDLFDDTLVICGCSKCQWLKENPWRVTLTHYTNDWLPNVEGTIPPTVVKNPIGDIEKTRTNYYLCSFSENLEFKTTMSCPKLTNPYDSITGSSLNEALT